jgi:hypothetical protein
LIAKTKTALQVAEIGTKSRDASNGRLSCTNGVTVSTDAAL